MSKPRLMTADRIYYENRLRKVENSLIRLNGEMGIVKRLTYILTTVNLGAVASILTFLLVKA